MPPEHQNTQIVVRRPHRFLWLKILLGAGAVAGVGIIIIKRKDIARALGNAGMGIKKAATTAASTIAETAKDLVSNIFGNNYFSVKPSPQLVTYIQDAAKKYSIPLYVMMAIVYNEARFRENSPFRAEPKSWEKWKGKKIPGSTKKWGDCYKQSEWGSYGPMQVLPFNFVGVSGGLKPCEPLSKGHDPRFNVDMAARLVKGYYNKTGSWSAAIARYNGTGPKAETMYVLHVATHVAQMGAPSIINASQLASIKNTIQRYKSLTAAGKSSNYSTGDVAKWEKALNEYERVA